MYQLLKKYAQTKLPQLLLSACIVYAIFYSLAILHKDVYSIEKQQFQPTSFLKLHQPKTIAVKQKTVSKKTEKVETKKAAIPIPEDTAVISEPEKKIEKVSDEPTPQTAEETAPTDLSQVDDAVPVLLQRIRPRYPEVAKKAAVEANVLLELIIREKGSVIFAHILYCSQPGYGFEQSAIRAAKKLSFKPFTKQGKATKVKITYPINFKLI